MVTSGLSHSRLVCLTTTISADFSPLTAAITDDGVTCPSKPPEAAWESRGDGSFALHSPHSRGHSGRRFRWNPNPGLRPGLCCLGLSGHARAETACELATPANTPRTSSRLAPPPTPACLLVSCRFHSATAWKLWGTRRFLRSGCRGERREKGKSCCTGWPAIHPEHLVQGNLQPTLAAVVVSGGTAAR